MRYGPELLWSGLFKKPKPPVEKPPVTMPDENDPAVRAAGQSRVRKMRGVSGRDSTIMSGGGNYEDETLG